MNSVAVFCGSSKGNDKKILSDAYSLGKYLASKKTTLVYGGARIGIMGEVASGVLENAGEVIGVIPDFLKIKEVVHTGLTELVVTKTMHERKLIMHERSDGFVTLPGGFGTLEEFFEIITWAQLGLHTKPVGVLNSNGFYDELLDMLHKMVAKGLLKKENYEMIQVDADVAALMEKMHAYIPQQVPKWIHKKQV